MYEKILVPLDGSKLAEASLPYAEKLARRIGSQITLISVLLLGSESDEDQYHHLHQFYIQEMAKTMKEKAIDIKSVIVTGDAAEQITDYADKKNIDLIVMGTRGRSALKRWVLGSVADKVVGATSCPVSLVYSKDTEAGVQGRRILCKALVILDGTAEGEIVIPYVEELASKLDMEVTLLHLVEEALIHFESVDDRNYIPVSKKEMNSRRAKARRYLTKLASLLESKGITVRVKVVTKGRPAETIIKVANKIDADLLAMSTRGRSGISRWIFGSVRDDIVNIGNTLVLLVGVPE
jgi:nucleotide-binding universal stress UspA family protein